MQSWASRREGKKLVCGENVLQNPLWFYSKYISDLIEITI